jgi:hypothetical protein
MYRCLSSICLGSCVYELGLTQQQGTLHPEVVYLPFFKRAAVAFITRKINKAAFVLRLFDVPSMQRSMRILFQLGHYVGGGEVDEGGNDRQGGVQGLIRKSLPRSS